MIKSPEETKSRNQERFNTIRALYAKPIDNTPLNGEY